MSEAILLFILLLKGICERLLSRRLFKVILCCQGILLSLHQLRRQQAFSLILYDQIIEASGRLHPQNNLA